MSLDEDVLARAARVRLLLMDVDGVMTDGTYWQVPDGQGGLAEIKAFDSQDGIALQWLRRVGIKAGLISGRVSVATEERGRSAGFEHVYMGHVEKIPILEEILEKAALPAEAVGYIGDDYTDVVIMHRVGFAIATANAKPEVKAEAHYVTEAPGGHGAVRETVELLLKAQRPLGGDPRSLRDRPCARLSRRCAAAPVDDATTAWGRHRPAADRVFRACVAVAAAMTVAALWSAFGGGGRILGTNRLGVEAVARVVVGFTIVSVLWGWLWYGIRSLLLAKLVGLSKDERRMVFRSRMDGTFDLASLLARHSERRIRIVDMIGRRGRFITIAAMGFGYIYTRVRVQPTPEFLGAGMQESLLDSVALSWAMIAAYYSSGFFGRVLYGAQMRIMDGTLARANCLLITTLWMIARFLVIPIGGQIARVFPPALYGAVFAFVWLSYIAGDAASEVVGSLFGKPEAARLGPRRRQPQVRGRDVGVLPRVLRPLRRDRRGAGPACGLVRPRPRRGGLEHGLRAVLAARHGRRHDGHRERAPVLGVRRARALRHLRCASSTPS